MNCRVLSFTLFFSLAWSQTFGSDKPKGWESIEAGLSETPKTSALQQALDRKNPDHLCARELALSLFSEGIIRTLQRRHFELVQAYQPGSGEGLQGKTFNPKRLLSDDQAMELLKTALSDDLQLVFPDEAMELDDFVNRWEREFVSAGGTLSQTWYGRTSPQAETGKKKFLQWLILELAFVYQERHGGISQPDSPSFILLENDEASALPQYRLILSAFGRWEDFQSAFQRLADQKVGRRIPFVKLSAEPARTATEREMRGRGLPVRRRTVGPMRAERDRTTTRDVFVTMALEAYRSIRGTHFPLQALFGSSTNTGNSGGGQFQWIGNNLPHWLAHRASHSLDDFIDELNIAIEEEGLPVLKKGTGARNWYQELVIQMAGAHVRENGGEMEFQAEDKSADNYIEMDNHFIVKSRLNLFEINRLVRTRLQELRDENQRVIDRGLHP